MLCMRTRYILQHTTAPRHHAVVICVGSGALPLHMVDEAAVERNLLTKGLPDPDVLIRTSGEKRVR